MWRPLHSYDDAIVLLISFKVLPSKRLKVVSVVCQQGYALANRILQLLCISLVELPGTSGCSR